MTPRELLDKLDDLDNALRDPRKTYLLRLAAIESAFREERADGFKAALEKVANAAFHPDQDRIQQLEADLVAARAKVESTEAAYQEKARLWIEQTAALHNMTQERDTLRALMVVLPEVEGEGVDGNG